MKYFLFFLLICISGNHHQTELVEKCVPILTNLEQEHEEEYFREEFARYKYGDRILLKSLHSSIKNVPLDDVENYFGVYQIEIDTNGVVRNSIAVRSISIRIDSAILQVCDTLSFYPGRLNGRKVVNKVTVPFRVEVEE